MRKLLAAWRRLMGLSLWTRTAICVWLVMVSAVLIRVAVSKPTSQSVVPIYLAAGKHWFESKPLYPRDAESNGGLDLYRNPPGVAALFVPFALVGDSGAALLWRFVGILMYGTALVSFARSLFASPPPWKGGEKSATARCSGCCPRY